MIHSHIPLRKKGFALVLSLILMAFILLLMLCMATFIQVEVSIAIQNTYRKKAEENARLAAMIALGELQKALGPDQRISAPGGQRLSAGSTSSRQHWVGVYDAWLDSADTRPTPTFHQWLISGDPDVVSDITSVEKSTALSDVLITLVPAEYDESDSLIYEPVEAGLVLIGETGAYAWWISEENTKAKLGNTVPDALSVIESTDRLQAAPRAAHEFLFSTPLPASSPLLDKLISKQQFAMSDFGVNLEKTPYHHDYSLTAQGLLTNVRSGGFRKDLSLYLQQPWADLAASLPSEYEPLYRANGRSGFRFFELWRDFNVWGEIQYLSNPPSHEDGGTIAPETPFFVAAPTASAAFVDPFIEYKHVTKLKTTLLFSLMAEEVLNPGGDPYYDLYLVVEAVFTIWNPNNIAMQIPSSTFITFKTWPPPYDLILRFDQGASLPTYEKSLFAIFPQNLMNVELGKQQDLVLRPGEVQIQSQREHLVKDHTAIFHHDVEAGIGYSFASGYRRKINYADADDRDGTQVITFSLKPSDDPGSGWGLFLSGYAYGKPDVPGQQTASLGNHSINSSTGNSDLKASDFPHVFPTIEEDLSRNIKIHEPDPNQPPGLTAFGKWPLATFTFGVKTEVDDPQFSGLPPSEQGTRMTGRSMLRFNPASFSASLFKLQPNMLRASHLQVGMRRFDSFSNSGIELDGNGLGYYGASYGAYDGTSYVISRSVAESPIHSIGAMQHFIPDGKIRVDGSGIYTFAYAYNYLQPSIQQAIGNSFAPSIISRNRSSEVIDNITFADHSYLANEVLWDDYFFSSVDPVSTPAYKDKEVAYSEQRSRFEQFIGAGGQPHTPLPNQRFLPWTDSPAMTLSDLFSSDGPYPDAYLKIASHLIVDGMFNVNSTSVRAWKAVLAGLKDANIPVRPADASSGTTTLMSASSPTANTIVPGLLVAGSGEIIPSTLSDPKEPDQWLGFRTLTDAQLDELAHAIVEQVRLRGPFLSLADFVNRRLSDDISLAQAGPLQSALDDPAVTINEAYRSGARSLSLGEASAQGFPFPEAEAAVKSTAAPGYVDQADILTSIGPLLSARGDTFTIRSYGETRNPISGETIARAYCEMIVQRTPDYVDPGDANEENASNLSSINKELGRRFRIISFRFMNPDEAS